MSLTRIGSIGINTGIKFSGLTTITTLNTSIDTLSIGGPVSIAGTLTYEDVTNIDSVGLITARNGIVVGSGITLSKDGDVFFTGIATGNGSGLTDLNASNLGSGTVPTARLGSGTASSSTFLRGDSTFQTVNTDLVSDTTPQLGGNLDVNTKNILFGDSSDGSSDDVLIFGAGSDLKLYHSAGNSFIANTTGDLLIRNTTGNEIKIQAVSGEQSIQCIGDGAVELYHDGAKKLETTGTGAVVTGILTAQSFVPTVGQFSHRNIVINGAMTVAQRGTSSAGGEGYKTVDRFQYYKSGTNETPNQAQVDVAAGTTPYTLGFRKAYQVENGNQSSAGGSDLVFIETNLEAQDIANSGWNYLSSSSYITLSFWVKSSVAQNFYGYLLTVDGTAYKYPFETGSLSANTWTKVTKTIPGNSNLQFDNDNNKGLGIVWWPFLGTGYTDSSVSLDTWATWSSGTRIPDATNTWYLTNDSTFQITGVQLEVGPVATPFEHRSFGDELARCQRYYQQYTGVANRIYVQNVYRVQHPLPVQMRATPTFTKSYGYSTGLQTDNTAADKDTLNWDIQYTNAGSGIIDILSGTLTLDAEI